MLTFAEHLERCRGSYNKARVAYMRERRWSAEQWYEAWQTTDLPAEVEHAARVKEGLP
jgi:hypothetical protein